MLVLRSWRQGRAEPVDRNAELVFVVEDSETFSACLLACGEEAGALVAGCCDANLAVVDEGEVIDFVP